MTSSPPDEVLTILDSLQVVREAYTRNELGAKKQLLELSYALTTALESPWDTIQRIRHAEVSYVSNLLVAMHSDD